MTDHSGPLTVERTAVATIAGPLAPEDYVAALRRLQRRYAAAFAHLAALDHPSPLQFSAGPAALRDELGVLLLLDSAARDLWPPARLEPVHRSLLQAVQCFTATAALVLHEMATTGRTSSEAAVAAMRDGIRYMDAVNDLLSAGVLP